MVVTLMLPKSCGHKTLSSGSHNPLAFCYFFSFKFVIVYKTKFNHFQVYRSVAGSAVTVSCSQFQAAFTTPRGSPERTMSLPLLCFLQPLLAVCGLACWGPFVEVQPSSVAFVWLLPLCRMSSGSLHAVTRGWLTPLYGWVILHHVMDPISFTHTSLGGRLGCFHLLAVCEKCTANIWMRVTN